MFIGLLQIIFSMIFLTIIYFSTGLPVEAERFLIFSFIGIIISLTAEGMGLFVGSIFNVTVSVFYYKLANCEC